MKHLFLTVSVLTLISSPSFATWQQDVKDQVNLEMGQNKIIQKLMKSQDYTIDLDEGSLTSTIAEVVKVKNQGKGLIQPKSSDITFETRHQIVNTLDRLKNSNAVFGGSKRLTKNLKQGVLSVGDPYVSLVYPVFKRDREASDAFLPLTYQSSYNGAYQINCALWDEIKNYAYGRGLSTPEAKRLYHYLEPLFYVAQEEVGKLVTGLHNRWCWTQGSREDMTTLLKQKTDHHTMIISNAGLVGFNPDQVKHWLMPRLLDQIFAILPNPFTELYQTGGSIYKLGVNYHNKISMIHPITELPYPIFTEDRGQPDWNLPKNYQRSVVLNKQWDRVHDFVRLHDGISPQEKLKTIMLLEPVGYFFHKKLENFHVRGGDLPDPEMGAERIIEMAREFSRNHTIFPPFLEMFYNGNVDVHSALRDVQDKDNCHVILTANLWPQRLFDQKRYLADDLLNYLMFKDIVDRFKVFYPDKARQLDSMSLALN